MKQLEKVQNNTTWAKASNAINNNNDALYVAVTTLEHAAFKNKGYFKSVALLYGAYPTAENGAQAFVYNSSNPTSAPYDIYEWVNGGWQDSGVNGGNVNVNLDSKQDTLVGYSESVSGGKATQVAIQGDTIALSGKVSLGNVDDMESAILMSSSQAGAAVAKANTVEQSMSALKSPVKPIHLNSQGKLELNIGKGLYVEDGKLCTTGASGGGGGGTTLSEGQGIRIYNDTINVAYDIDTLRINSCGGLTVNYGEGLTIKNGKLSAQTSVNAGNGLVKKGDALQVSVGTGLLVADDVYVNIGKGLATDNENKVNVNLDEQTLTTDSSGKIIINKYSLIGNGLKQEFGKLAVNYGTGLALSNKALVIDYGAGLDIQDGKLVSTVQGGKTYVGGQAVNITGNEINVKYDGVTISTKDSPDNSLHVMLGSGLIQGTSGIDVAVGSGLAIGSDNKLYSTVSSGKTYTAGDGIDISGNKIAVLYGSGLTTNSCGELKVDVGILVSGGRGLLYNNDGTMGVNVGRGLKIDSCQVVVNYGTGLKVVNNTLDVDTSKIAGAGIDLDSAYKTLTIGTKAAQELAGKGLVAEGPRMKVKYGSGLTTNACGGLIVDAANLTVGKANRADVAHGITIHQEDLPHGGGSYAWYNVYHSVTYSQGDAIILSLRHSYHHLQTDSITVAINVGYGKATITQMNATTGAGAYDKIRVRWLDNQKVYVDVRILSNYANTDMHYVQGIGSGAFTPPTPTLDDTGTICELSIHQGGFYAPKVWADTFEGNLTGTASRATADANGNKITETYARRFMPTNGLEINSDRELFLPNLTASVVNGAVDGSKNGAQRVLNLNCGVIQIKLSTGLAIDDNGYLYIQDKYVTK